MVWKVDEEMAGLIRVEVWLQQKTGGLFDAHNWTVGLFGYLLCFLIKCCYVGNGQCDCPKPLYIGADSVFFRNFTCYGTIHTCSSIRSIDN